MWKGLKQLVRVVQLVKLHIIMETYSPVKLWGRGSSQLVQVVQLVKLHISIETYSPVEL